MKTTTWAAVGKVVALVALVAAGCRQEPPADGAGAAPAARATGEEPGAAPAVQGATSEPGEAPSAGAVAPPRLADTAEPTEITPLDPALLVTPAALAAEVAAASPPALLDVRGEPAWQVGHMRDALPVPLYALATSAPVRAGRVVIVDEGYGTRAVDAVAALRAEGRDARLLEGGVALWCREARPMEGTCTGADLMDAASVIADEACPGRVTLVALRAPADAARAAAALPRSRFLAWTAPDDVAAAARAASTAGTLVIVGEEDRLDALRAAIPADLTPLVFYARGGIDAVERARLVQKAAATHPAIVTRGVTGAESNQQVLRSPKGCGCR